MHVRLYFTSSQLQRPVKNYAIIKKILESNVTYPQKDLSIDTSCRQILSGETVRLVGIKFLNGIKSNIIIVE